MWQPYELRDQRPNHPGWSEIKTAELGAVHAGSRVLGGSLPAVLCVGDDTFGRPGGFLSPEPSGAALAPEHRPQAPHCYCVSCGCWLCYTYKRARKACLPALVFIQSQRFPGFASFRLPNLSPVGFTYPVHAPPLTVMYKIRHATAVLSVCGDSASSGQGRGHHPQFTDGDTECGRAGR